MAISDPDSGADADAPAGDTDAPAVETDAPVDEADPIPPSTATGGLREYLRDHAVHAAVIVGFVLYPLA